MSTHFYEHSVCLGSLMTTTYSNKTQKQLKDMLLKELSPNKIKTIASDF